MSQTRPDPRAEAEAGIRAALANIETHVEVIRDMLTNTLSLKDDIARRLDRLTGRTGEAR